MRQVLLGTRRATTLAEALLASLVLAAGLAVVLYGFSALVSDVDHGRIFLFSVGMPLVRFMLDAVPLLLSRE